MNPTTEIELNRAQQKGLRFDHEAALRGKVVRGDVVVTPGGAEGMFVGISQGGVTWICYAPAQFMRAAARFDRTQFGLDSSVK